MNSVAMGCKRVVTLWWLSAVLVQFSSAQTDAPTQDTAATVAVFDTDFESTDAGLIECPKGKVCTGVMELANLWIFIRVKEVTSPRLFIRAWLKKLRF